jgi:hypothetical protein
MIVVPTNENGVPLEPIPYERPAIVIGSLKLMYVFDDIEEYLNFLNPPSPPNPDPGVETENNETI